MKSVEMTDMDKIRCVIDYYIAHLQVGGYRVRLNNHNIGDLHNVTITKMEEIEKKWWWFGAPYIIYTQEVVYSDAIRLPGDIKNLIRLFECYLSKSNVSWESLEY